MPKPTDEYLIQQVNAAVVLNNSTDIYVEEFKKPIDQSSRVINEKLCGARRTRLPEATFTGDGVAC